MNFWILCINFIWIFMFFVWTSESFWVYGLAGCLETCERERKVELSLHADALGNLLTMSSIFSLVCRILICSNWYCIFAFAFVFVLCCNFDICHRKHVLCSSEFFLISLRMICNNFIWWYHNLIVKLDWSATCITCRMILLEKYF